MESVTTAFELMKLELDTTVEDLNSQGVEMFRASRYEEARLLTERGTSLRDFCERIEELASEWQLNFAGAIEDEPSEEIQQAARTILSASKASSTRLLVVFNDNTAVAEKTAAQTLAKVIERIGFERVAALKIHVNKENIVSKAKSTKYQDFEIHPYFIKTHSNTFQKKRQLEQISNELGLGLEITVI